LQRLLCSSARDSCCGGIGCRARLCYHARHLPMFSDQFATRTTSVFSRLGFLLVAILLLANPALSAELRNPFAGSAKAAKAGEYEFRINCALCHGLGARGGGR